VRAVTANGWIAMGSLYAVIVLLGITNTVGYHRLLTHRSFQTTKWLRAALTIACAQYSGSPMAWVGAHRVHQYADSRLTFVSARKTRLSSDRLDPKSVRRSAEPIHASDCGFATVSFARNIILSR